MKVEGVGAGRRGEERGRRTQEPTNIYNDFVAI